MAQTGAYQPIRPWDIERVRQGTLPPAFVQESASLNVKAGTPVVYDSSRQLAACAASFTQVSFITQDDSANAASAGTLLSAWQVTPNEIFEVTLNEALALNQMGNSYGLVKDATTGYWYLSTANTGNQMRIVGVVQGWNVGDTKSRVLAVFNPAVCQVSSNSLLPGVGTAIASAATIAPTNLVHHVTGTTTINTITVPAGMIDGGQIVIVPDGLFATGTSGNIALATTAVVSKAIIFTYDRTAVKWYPSY